MSRKRRSSHRPRVFLRATFLEKTERQRDRETKIHRDLQIERHREKLRQETYRLTDLRRDLQIEGHREKRKQEAYKLTDIEA